MSDSPAPAAGAPDPACGGSYSRDPDTGALTLVERSGAASTPPPQNPQPE